MRIICTLPSHVEATSCGEMSANFEIITSIDLANEPVSFSICFEVPFGTAIPDLELCSNVCFATSHSGTMGEMVSDLHIGYKLILAKAAKSKAKGVG